MRSFAFGSIQDQSAELGNERRGGLVCPSLRPCYSFRVEGGGEVFGVTALKLKDRRRDATASLLSLRFVLLPSSPWGSGRGGEGFLVWLFLMCLWWWVFFFWFWVHFWYPFRENVTPAVTATVGPRPWRARPGAPSFPEVWNRGSVPEIKLPRGLVWCFSGQAR